MWALGHIDMLLELAFRGQCNRRSSCKPRIDDHRGLLVDATFALMPRNDGAMKWQRKVDATCGKAGTGGGSVLNWRGIRR
jgi:hypothetical protein